MKEIKDAFGPLWELYSKSSVSEIIVDSIDDIYYEESGKIHNYKGRVFSSDEEIVQTINKLIEYSGRKLKEGQYSMNFVVDETTNIMIVLPPLSIKGPILNLTKIPNQSFGWSDYLKFGAIEESGKKLIEDLLKDNKSFLVSGPVGSGKTTLLNMLVDTIDKEQRVVTIEKMANLVTNRKRVARLQTENNKAEELIELVDAARSMRADYVILNDIQGPETMPFLSLLHEGHSGMALIGAENVFDALRRLELKALSSDFTGTIEDIRYAISSAFDYVIFQEKCEDGKRRVTRVGKIICDGNRLNLDIVYKV